MTIDFSSQAHYLIALAPELVLTVWGMIVLLAGVSRRHASTVGRTFDLGWLSLVGVLLAALANGWLYGVTEVGVSSMIAVDGFARFANWIFLIAAGFGILMSMAYVERQALQVGEFFALMLLSTVGMMVMVAARDLIVIFLGLEVMSISVYAMTAMNRRDRKSAEAGLKYFILGAFSTGFFLYGIALTYGGTGSTNITEIAVAVASGSTQPALLLFGVALMLIGFAFKVSAVPFHMWTPDVYEGAPTPVTAFMSVAVKAAAFLAFLRVFTVAFDGLYPTWVTIAWWLSAITMVVANLIAVQQTNVKRMLAYSSVAHGGYLLVGIVAANAEAGAGMLFYLLVYTLMNMGVFGVVMLVGRQSESSLDLEDYAGLGQHKPVLGAMLTILLLSLAGFPGTGGFIGKIFILQGAMESHLLYLSIVLVLTTVISYYYYLRVAWYVWMRDAPEGADFGDVPTPMPLRVGLLVAVALILYTGVFPEAVLDMARSGISSIAAFAGG